MTFGFSPNGTLHLPRIADIARVEDLTERERMLELQFLDGSKLGHVPGQFVEVSAFGIGEAPISISSSPTNGLTFQLAVRKVGNVTQALHRLKQGDKVGVRGPFGNGFPIDTLRASDILFVAGGIGLFPLRSLIQYVLDNRSDFGRLIILFGSRRPQERVFVNDLEGWKHRRDVEFHETVDVGDATWKGNVGVITTLFPHVSFDPKMTRAVVVGPPVMYRFVVAELLKRNIAEENIIMSLERRMKCGMGKCGHCQLGGYYVCKEGPVFTYPQLKAVKEAV